LVNISKFPVFYYRLILIFGEFSTQDISKDGLRVRFHRIIILRYVATQTKSVKEIQC